MLVYACLLACLRRYTVNAPHSTSCCWTQCCQVSGEPIATIKAVHTGPNAGKASLGDASGCEALICLVCGARIMLTSNLWTDTGLENGAMGTVQAICYQSGGSPSLPVAVMVRIDKYWGPTLHEGSVPIVPQWHIWIQRGSACSQIQIPFKLAWAITMHKAQRLTLDKVKFSADLTFVACSCVCRLSDIIFDPPNLLTTLAKSMRLTEHEVVKMLAMEHGQLPLIPPQRQHCSLFIALPSLHTSTTRWTTGCQTGWHLWCIYVYTTRWLLHCCLHVGGYDRPIFHEAFALLQREILI